MLSKQVLKTTSNEINSAIKALKNNSNPTKAINSAMIDLYHARLSYDGMSGMTMLNLFETYDIIDDLGADDTIRNALEFNTNKKSIAYFKKASKELHNSHMKYVIMTNNITPNNSRLHFLTKKNVLHLAKIMEKGLKSPVYVYNACAHVADKGNLKGENISMFFRSLTNYLFSINKTSLLKKFKLAQRQSVLNSLPLFSEHTQSRVKKQLSKWFYVDMFKVSFHKDDLKVAKPTIHDVDKITKAIV